MPSHKPITKRTIIELTADAAAGASHRSLAKKYSDVSDRTIRVLRKSGVSVPEWRSEVSRCLRGAVDETIVAYREALAAGKVPPNNLALALGILVDKLDKFESRQSVEATQINVLVNSYGDRSRDEILAELRMGSEPVEMSPVALSTKTVSN